jgi:hypothetical protein
MKAWVAQWVRKQLDYLTTHTSLPPRWPPQCSCVVIESNFDLGERLQAPGSLWFSLCLEILTWFLVYECRWFLCEFPIGSYVKLSSAVGGILVERPNCRTNIWKRTIQWLFQQNLVLIKQMVSDKKIFIFSSVVCSSTFHILIFSSETTGPIATKLWWSGPWMAPFQNCVQNVCMPNTSKFYYSNPIGFYNVC